ncbi:MAG: DNA recombination protein RmuC [Candidatus Delongbacteria bacterium]|nr:DNA recombination protein RmuC [Candidatus Delongbacteria bacterium]MBN2833733.1 DNA recombination protein RmuC [Candidatus Delongbacteria bacterium]
MEIYILILIVVLGISGLFLIILNVRKNRLLVCDKLAKIESDLLKNESTYRDDFYRFRDENLRAFRDNREELTRLFNSLSETLKEKLDLLSSSQIRQFSGFSEQIDNLIKNFDSSNKWIQAYLEGSFKTNRIELNETLGKFSENLSLSIKEFNTVQKEKFESLEKKYSEIKNETESKLKEIRETVEFKLKSIQDDNSQKLEEMRKTVDEKLQNAVEKKFNDSFKMISERLEQVHKGLGEMQNLASGVGDLKKVLTNVKTRGNLGEIQLGTILEQILSPEQYILNASVKPNSMERVEYAIKLPSKDSNEKFLLLPVDSKFPNEDYQRLLDAYDNQNSLTQKEFENISKQFENSIKKNAKDIKDKYINPPQTTDFAIMFVPTEGLYAEVLRRTGLFEFLQREYKISVVGPTNFVAFLSSLQMGFKTLAIEKRSSEVWELLGAVKTEFGNFGMVLEKTKKKLQEAANVIDKAEVRTRVIERKLRDVQEIPATKSASLLDSEDFSENYEDL